MFAPIFWDFNRFFHGSTDDMIPKLERQWVPDDDCVQMVFNS